MDNSLNFIQSRIIANAIIDWCNIKSNEGFIKINNSFVSSYSKFRFTTPILELVHPNNTEKNGYWKNGISILYEIVNDNGNLSVSLLVSLKDVKEKDKIISFLKSNMIESSSELIVIKTWNVFSLNSKLENLTKFLDHFLFVDLKTYEEEVKKWINNNNYMIYDINYELVEGAIKNISSNIYERNKEARQKCIDYHGSKCLICGFDFGKFYGESFEGKIEVHHIKPLNEIQKEYIVDPIKDLIPVCPNCHMVLHSKENGVYSPEEVRNMIKK